MCEQVEIDRDSPDALAQELRRRRREIDRLEVEFADLVAEFAASEDWDARDEFGPVHWLRETCHMSWTAANGALAVGEMQQQLVKSRAAVDKGSIGFSHLALMATTARQLEDSPSGRAFEEERLLKHAMNHAVSQFRRDCVHYRHACDAEAVLAEEITSVEARFLELNPCPGGVFLNGFLDAVGGASLRAALAPLARKNGKDDDRSARRRMADALVELISNGQRAEMLVTTSLETLLGLVDAPAAELEFSPPIPAATVQRLACDAGITRVVLGPDSAVIDVGREHRVPNPATRRAMHARDRGCVWPRCDRPAPWTVPHHLMFWGHGGETELQNLVSLCQRHHWMVHEGGWQVLRADDRGIVVVAPIPGYLQRIRAPDGVVA